MKHLQLLANSISMLALGFLLLSSFTTAEDSPSQTNGIDKIEDTFLLGEVRIFMGWYEPVGWRFCDGREIEVARNKLLFDVIGNIHGGTATFDQNTYEWTGTFKLPNLESKRVFNNGASNWDYYNYAGKYMICTFGQKTLYWDTWNQYHSDGILNGWN